MIEAFVAATAIVLFFAIAIGILIAMIDDIIGPIIGVPLLCIWFIVVLAAMIYGAKQEDEKGPCLEYRTQLAWNAATKTMMPARVCVERGEWVK